MAENLSDPAFEEALSIHSFDLIEYPEPETGVEATAEKEDPAVTKVILDPSLSESEKISAIADIRGNFSGDVSIIERFLCGTIPASTALDRLAGPIDEAYSTADHGRQLYEAEQTARHQRAFHTTDKAAELWGLEEDIPEPGPETDDLPSAEGGLWELWYGVLHIAKQIPWTDDVRQDKLVDLVRQLKARPDPPLPERMTIPLRNDWIWTSGRLWSTLSMLGPSAREAWNDSCGCGSGWTIPEQHAWANVNGFVARITAAGLSDFTLYAKWALRDALEEQIRGDTDHMKTDVTTKTSLLLTVACVWITVAGRYMYENSELVNSDTLVASDLRGKKLPWNRGQGNDAIGVDRWDFWRRRLLEEASREKLPDHVRSLAATCAQKIASFEHSTPNISTQAHLNIPSATSRLLSDW